MVLCTWGERMKGTFNKIAIGAWGGTMKSTFKQNGKIFRINN